MNSPANKDASLLDLLDEAITKIVALNIKACPNKAEKILRVLRMNPKDIKVVILGQDPYPEPNIATGLAFACPQGMERPSLSIIKRELRNEYQLENLDGFDDSLESWERQGVFLLNSSLSCTEFIPNSHRDIWQPFMAALIREIDLLKITENIEIVFVFLGGQAKSFSNLVHDYHHTIFCYHPAAEIRGDYSFVGFFKLCNSMLKEKIQWI